MEDKTSLIMIAVFLGLLMAGMMSIHDHVYKDLPEEIQSNYFLDMGDFSYVVYTGD